ncbi:ABC transporter substrate-binding protein [Brenneria rubrifaciens]|uniref:ABC transporter substrate-binding protein n=1 Tax=Brenneria rubrifaciens TaxID=55213 RepID=A0A4P8QTW5_9GAMM|nr:ABC transporter substrate-binding protein [Brenneria rubrifaciens]QCR07625.1 ABC transporter substrate-binding protein [Brenneria rubrifaciens]
MKKHLFAFPLLMLGLLPSAFSADQNVPTTRTIQVQEDAALKAKVPESIIKRGFIVAGTNPNTPPTTFYQEDNKTLAGREIDIMNAIGDRLGVPVNWRDTGGFDNIIPGLKSGRYDVALSNINATQKRLAQIDFIGYFNSTKLAIISLKDTKVTPFTSLSAVCGKEVGAGAGTTQLLRLQEADKACVAAQKHPIKIAIFPDRPAGVQAVISGRVPMFFGPYEGLRYQVSQVKRLEISGDIAVNDAPVSIAFPKNSELEDAVQAALNSLIKDGTYQKILDKWDIGYGAVNEAKRNAEIFG